MLANPARSVRSAEKGLLRKEGEYWTVGYGVRVFRLKATKGLAYLAQLLRSPGTDVHALDLVGVGGTSGYPNEYEPGLASGSVPHYAEELARMGLSVGTLGDAGELLDEQAKTTYRRRLVEQILYYL